MRFGWLTLSHSPSAADDHAAIEEQLTQACLAEEVGFDSVWLTEHNFTGEAVYCDPIPFASALAARTSRVRYVIDLLPTRCTELHATRRSPARSSLR